MVFVGDLENDVKIVLELFPGKSHFGNKKCSRNYSHNDLQLECQINCLNYECNNFGLQGKGRPGLQVAKVLATSDRELDGGSRSHRLHDQLLEEQFGLGAHFTQVNSVAMRTCLSKLPCSKLPFSFSLI